MTATAPEQTAPASAKKRPYKHPATAPRYFNDPGQLRRVHAVTLPDDVPYEESLKPTFWFSIAPHMRIGDNIELQNDALSFWAMQKVVASDPSANYVEVRELYFKELEPAIVDQSVVDGFETAYRGITEKWVVIRSADGHVMASGIETRREALYQIQTVMKPRLVGGR